MPELRKYRMSRSTTAHHCALDRRGFSVIASYEEVFGQLNTFANRERWQHCGQGVGNRISGNLLPIFRGLIMHG
jgi:hypothetical protein